MATVGQPLTAPEAGWKRFDDTNQNISYIGTWSPGNTGAPYYNNTKNNGYGNSEARFNFVGSKLRIIGYHGVGRSTSVSVYLDGIYRGDFNQYVSTEANQIFRCLEFSITNLENKEHYVSINNNSSDEACCTIDAIDIDENEELLPYNPSIGEPGQAILRVTMLDSSEREYKLSMSEVDGFISWLDSHSSGGTLSYRLNTAFGSREYLLFDKIISFEVIPVA